MKREKGEYSRKEERDCRCRWKEEEWRKLAEIMGSEGILMRLMESDFLTRGGGSLVFRQGDTSACHETTDIVCRTRFSTNKKCQ